MWTVVALKRLPSTGDGQYLVIARRNLSPGEVSMVRRRTFDGILGYTRGPARPPIPKGYLELLRI